MDHETEMRVLAAVAVFGGPVGLREAVDAAWQLAGVGPTDAEVVLRAAIADGRVQVRADRSVIELELSVEGLESLGSARAVRSAEAGDRRSGQVDHDHGDDLDRDGDHWQRQDVEDPEHRGGQR